MSLQADGKAAIAALVNETKLFPRIKPADWKAAAVKLAKKQIVAAGLTAADLIAIQTALGGPVFDDTLNDLTAFQAKLLAKRIDPKVTQDEIASKSMALRVIRDTLSQAKTGEPGDAVQIETDAPSKPDQPKANPYLGRKAFRVR